MNIFMGFTVKGFGITVSLNIECAAIKIETPNVVSN